MKLKQNNRARKARIWTTHQKARYDRSVNRKWGNYWGWLEGAYGTAPVPGRLIPTSKLRRRGGSR